MSYIVQEITAPDAVSAHRTLLANTPDAMDVSISHLEDVRNAQGQPTGQAKFLVNFTSVALNPSGATQPAVTAVETFMPGQPAQEGEPTA